MNTDTDTSVTSNSSYRSLIVLIMLMTPITGAGIEIYLSALPDLVLYFHTDTEQIKWTLTAYLLFNCKFSHSHNGLQFLLLKSLAINELNINKLTCLNDCQGIILVSLLILPYLRNKFG